MSLRHGMSGQSSLLLTSHAVHCGMLSSSAVMPCNRQPGETV